MTTWRVRAAVAIWIGGVVVVWNAIFDRVVVLAGRQYIERALEAARSSRPYERIDDWMPAATLRGFWLATTAAGLMLIAGLVGAALLMRRQR